MCWYLGRGKKKSGPWSDGRGEGNERPGEQMQSVLLFLINCDERSSAEAKI